MGFKLLRAVHSFPIAIFWVTESMSMQSVGVPPVHRVLYIEDNPANQKLVARILCRRLDISFVMADDAATGLAEVTRQPPDLLLLDLCLPDRDGFSVFSEIRSQPGLPRFPIVAVSANAMPSDIERAFALGFDDYVVKPFDLMDFSQIVARFLGN